MPRQAQRVAFKGPFRGINEAVSEDVLEPAFLRQSSEIENFHGRLRTRRGMAFHSTLPNGNGPVVNLFEFKYDSTMTRVHILAFYADGRLDRYVPDTTPYWQSVNTLLRVDGVTYDTFAMVGERKYAFQSERNLYICGEDDDVWVYRAEIPNTESAEGTIQASGTSWIQLEVDTTKPPVQYDWEYSAVAHEVEILSGPAAGSIRQVLFYVDNGDPNGSRILYIQGTFPIQPNAGDTYRIWRHHFRKAGLDKPTAVLTGDIAGGTIPTATELGYRVTFYDPMTGIESEATAEVSRPISPVGGTVRIYFKPPALLTRTGFSPPGVYNLTGSMAYLVRIYQREQAPNVETDWRLLQQIDSWNVMTNFGADPAQPLMSYVDDVGAFTGDQRGTRIAPLGNQKPPKSAFGTFHRGLSFFVPKDSTTIWYGKPVDSVTGEPGSEYVDNARNYAFWTLPHSDPITGIASLGQQLLVFQENAVYRVDVTPLLRATPGTPVQAKIVGASGCSEGHTIVEAPPDTRGEQKMYWMNRNGIHEYNGSNTVNLVEAIRDLWKVVLMTNVRTFGAVYDPNFGRYLLVVETTDHTFGPKVFFVWDQESRGWQRWTMIDGATGPMFSMLSTRDSNGRAVIWSGNHANQIFRWSTPQDEFLLEGSAQIPWSFTTGRLDLGDPAARKHLHEIEVTFDIESPNSTTVTIDVLLDEEDVAVVTKVATVAYNSSPVVVPVGAPARRVSLRLSGALSSPAIDVIGFVATYSMRGIRG